MYRGAGGLNAELCGHKDPGVQGAGVETLDGEVGESAGPVAVMYAHSVNGGEAVVVAQMQDSNVENERSV